jgi:membrane-associated phospholipid phosphatase
MAAEGVPAKVPEGAGPQPPSRRAAVAVGAVSVAVVVVSAWLAARPGAAAAQTGAVVWFNHPPQPVAAVFALVNPLLRPLPLLVLAVLLGGWVVLGAPGRRQRLECGRAIGLALLIAELVAQILKRVVDQPRPTAVIPGLDVHGYPQDPWGHAYPSAHTALTVAAVSAVWPWMNRWQRAAGLAMAVLVPLNRVYIGAHWPIDIVGGAAIGLLAASVCWLVAGGWPVGQAQAALLRQSP